VTVLFADIVGFTALSETRDPEQVKNLVDRCFERMVDDITAFGGVVDKIIGDAIVALFGAPLAHEDDAERAVRAALQIQSTLRAREAELGLDLQLRIGVNTGEVLVGALRAGGDYTAMGDVVNTAQRLQSAADPGTVLVGRATYLATREVIGYRERGPLDAKGREEPVEGWEAVSTVQPPGYRLRRHTPLIGRASEFAMVQQALETALDRRRAHLVLLLGEAGVGKTRLAEEVAETARGNHDALVLEGRCVPYGEANVWWPLAEALRQAAGIENGDDLAMATDRARAAIVALVEDTVDDVEIDRLVEGQLFLLGYEGPLRGIDPARALDEASLAVLSVLELAANRHPLVIVLSDLHWADEVVLQLVDDMMERLARLPVLVVATARQELSDRWTARQGRHNNLLVNLDPLDRSASEELLRGLLETELPSDVAELLLDRSGGNPFFLEELAALVGEAGSDGPAPLADGSLGDLPDTLRGLVSARLDALTPAERHTLEDASVWGRRGPLMALETMAESMRGTPDLAVVFEGLVDKEVLVIDGTHWSFRSDLVRDVAYSTLTKADRASRHYGIAHSFESHKGGHSDPSAVDDRMVDTISHHYGAAAELVVDLGPVTGIDDDVTEIALRWVAEAARRAEVAQVLPMAVRLFSQALRLAGTDHPDLRVELLLGRARAASELRQLDDAEVDVAEAAELAVERGDEPGRARADLVRGQLLERRGDTSGALEVLGRATAQFRELDDPDGMADALRAQGMTHLFRGENDAAEVAISEALVTSRSCDDRRGEAWAVQQLAWISFVSGRASEAEQRLLNAVDIFTDIGDWAGLGWARGLLAYAMFQQGRLDEAAELGGVILVEAHERGDQWGEGMMYILGASVRLWSGRAGEAVSEAESAVAILRRLGDRFGEVNSLAVLGRALVSLGRIDEGFAALDEGAHRPAGESDDGLEVLGLTALAGAAAQLGDPHRGEEAVAGLDAEWVRSSSSSSVERMVALALLHLQCGRLEPAVEAAERAASFDLGEGPSSYALAALALVRAAQGVTDEVIDLDSRVNDMGRATYLDKGTAKLAAILVRARRGDDDAAARFEAVVRAADNTDDRVASAVVRLTQAYGLEALGRDDAPAARRAAERALDDLGIEAAGWRGAIELILATTASARAEDSSHVA
jgi:class 3 adenylate cyclase/tetratricopeptide (TPR) repeat protein